MNWHLNVSCIILCIISVYVIHRHTFVILYWRANLKTREINRFHESFSKDSRGLLRNTKRKHDLENAYEMKQYMFGIDIFNNLLDVWYQWVVTTWSTQSVSIINIRNLHLYDTHSRLNWVCITFWIFSLLIQPAILTFGDVYRL